MFAAFSKPRPLGTCTMMLFLEGRRNAEDARPWIFCGRMLPRWRFAFLRLNLGFIGLQVRNTLTTQVSLYLQKRQSSLSVWGSSSPCS